MNREPNRESERGSSADDSVSGRPGKALPSDGSADIWVRIGRFAVLFVGVVGVYVLVALLVGWASDFGMGLLVASAVLLVMLTALAVRAGFTVLHGLWFLLPIVGFGFMVWVLWELTAPGVLFDSRSSGNACGTA